MQGLSRNSDIPAVRYFACISAGGLCGFKKNKTVITKVIAMSNIMALVGLTVTTLKENTSPIFPKLPLTLFKKDSLQSAILTFFYLGILSETHAVNDLSSCNYP